MDNMYTVDVCWCLICIRSNSMDKMYTVDVCWCIICIRSNSMDNMYTVNFAFQLLFSNKVLILLHYYVLFVFICCSLIS